MIYIRKTFSFCAAGASWPIISLDGTFYLLLVREILFPRLTFHTKGKQKYVVRVFLSRNINLATYLIRLLHMRGILDIVLVLAVSVNLLIFSDGCSYKHIRTYALCSL